MDACVPGAAALAGPLPVRVVRPTPPPCDQTPGLRGVRLRGRASRPSRPPWCSPACSAISCATPPWARSWRRIVSDEARTFGLEPLIAEAKIYAPEGQHYIPVDADLPRTYAESASGQLLQGHQRGRRVVDLYCVVDRLRHLGPADGAGVSVLFHVRLPAGRRPGLGPGRHARPGILAGCTAGRTTLMGEGLQHHHGQSPLLASTNPAALVYDASFAYEVAVIMEEAVTDMLGAAPQDLFWYLTLYNETYPMPALPEDAEGDAVRRGHHRRDLPVQ